MKLLLLLITTLTLSTNRNQFAITDPNVMLYLADKEGISNVEIFRVIDKKDLVIALRNDSNNRLVIERINKILKNR